MIEIKGLKKSFGKHDVLKGIDLTIHDKEVVVIIGPSGSGKSTILRCINYLEHPTAGEIIVDGISMSDAKSINSIRKEVGMVFQRFNLFPHMTVLENIVGKMRKKRQLSSWKRSAWPIRRTPIREPCPAASSSVLPLPAPWR